MRSQMIPRLCNDGGVDEVVEKFEGADTAVDDRFAMWPRRAPEPILKKLERPTARGTPGSCRRIRRLGWHEICLQGARGLRRTSLRAGAA
jgi:hypothetical protein